MGEGGDVFLKLYGTHIKLYDVINLRDELKRIAVLYWNNRNILLAVSQLLLAVLCVNAER